jgi:hypothetical protein
MTTAFDSLLMVTRYAKKYCRLEGTDWAGTYTLRRRRRGVRRHRGRRGGVVHLVFAQWDAQSAERGDKHAQKARLPDTQRSGACGQAQPRRQAQPRSERARTSARGRVCPL